MTGAHHLGIQVGDEEAGGLVHSVGAPVLGLCQKQYFLPILQIGDDLEGFGDLASSEAAHDLAHCLVHLYHLGLQTQRNDWSSILPVRSTHTR